MEIVPYKQTLGESCLVSCLLMVLKATQDIEFGSEQEKDIFISTIQNCREFYVVGTIKEFIKRYPVKVLTYVDNAYFREELGNYFPDAIKTEFQYREIDIGLIESLLLKNLFPIITLDKNLLDSYEDAVHAVHFVIVEKINSKGEIVIVDPWEGEKIPLSKKRLVLAINTLKNRLNTCPLAITTENMVL